MTIDTAQRRITVSPTAAVPPELLVHALAQVPDDVVLALTDTVTDRESLRLLADAYGISTRLEFDCHLPTSALSPSTSTMAELVEELGPGGNSPGIQRYADELLLGERIVIVTNLPTHYRVALFNRLAERLHGLGAHLRVLFLAGPPSTRPWMVPGEPRFDHEFMRGIDVRRDRGRRVVPIDLKDRLVLSDATLLLSAGFSPAVSGRVALFARRQQIPFGIWSEGIGSGGSARNPFRRVQRRWLMRRASFAIAAGVRSAEYLHELRPDLPVVHGRSSTPIPRPRRERSSGVVELLTVGRAESYKRLDLAIDAVRSLSNLPIRLTVVGSGNELPSLRDLAAGDERIRILGGVDSDRVGELYREADIFLFPSEYDPFGLVLVEAMGAGLAVVSSPKPGAVSDLAAAGRNCILIDGDASEWAKAIRRLVIEPKTRQRLGAAARCTVLGRWTIDHAAEAMVAGFRLGLLVASPDLALAESWRTFKK